MGIVPPRSGGGGDPPARAPIMIYCDSYREVILGPDVSPCSGKRGVAVAPSLTGVRIALRGMALRISRRKLSFDFPDGAPLEGKLVLLKDSQ